MRKNTAPEALQELEFRIEISQRWGRVCRMVGIDCTPEGAFVIGGRIMNDPEVRRLSFNPRYQIRDEEFPAAFETDWPKLFKALGPARCAALAARVRLPDHV